MRVRPLNDVPRWVKFSALLGLAAQIVWGSLQPAPRATAEALPRPQIGRAHV